MSDTPNAGPVELASPIGFEAVLHRVTEAIAAAGLTVFAQIDHSDGARQAAALPGLCITTMRIEHTCLRKTSAAVLGLT